MANFKIIVNNKSFEIEADPDTPLLWVLRDNLGLTGTKFGCGKAQCGACTVHLNGNAVRSCSLPVSVIGENKITTIEGVGNGKMHPVQKAWIENDVPQCGYCQSGQIMSAIALLNSTSHPSDEEINGAMNGNICRCGTYERIRNAIKEASIKLKSDV